MSVCTCVRKYSLFAIGGPITDDCAKCFKEKYEDKWSSDGADVQFFFWLCDANAHKCLNAFLEGRDADFVNGNLRLALGHEGIDHGIIRILLEHGADPTIDFCDEVGNTLLDLAKMNGYKTVIDEYCCLTKSAV